MKCLNPSCTLHEWNETALELGRLSSSHHVSKNTLLLPAQGYVVVRFRANNPGHWPLHCHNMMHNLEGMAVLLNVKDTKTNKPYSMIPRNRFKVSHPKFSNFSGNNLIENIICETVEVGCQVARDKK